MLPLVDEYYIHYPSYTYLQEHEIVYLVHMRNNCVQIDIQVDSTTRVCTEAQIHLEMP